MSHGGIPHGPRPGTAPGKGPRAGKGAAVGTDVQQRLAEEARRDRALQGLTYRLAANGVSPSGHASLFTRRGRKSVNQDSLLVWENFGGDPEATLCAVMDGHGSAGEKVSARIRDSLPSLILDALAAAAQAQADAEGGAKKFLPSARIVSGEGGHRTQDREEDSSPPLARLLHSPYNLWARTSEAKAQRRLGLTGLDRAGEEGGQAGTEGRLARALKADPEDAPRGVACTDSSFCGEERHLLGVGVKHLVEPRELSDATTDVTRSFSDSSRNEPLHGISGADAAVSPQAGALCGSPGTSRMLRKIPRELFTGGSTGRISPLCKSADHRMHLPAQSRRLGVMGSKCDSPDLFLARNQPQAQHHMQASALAQPLPLLSRLDWELAFEVMEYEIKTHPRIQAVYSGSTAVLALLQGRRLTVAHVGDSRCILGVRGTDGWLHAMLLTKDHRPCVEAERKRVQRAGGRVFADSREPQTLRVWLPKENLPGLAVTRAFGDEVLKSCGVVSRPEVLQVELDDTAECLILASDGVWDVLSPEEALQELFQPSVFPCVGPGTGVCTGAWFQDEDNSAKRIADLATDRYGHQPRDDISVVVLHLECPKASGTTPTTCFLPGAVASF